MKNKHIPHIEDLCLYEGSISDSIDMLSGLMQRLLGEHSKYKVTQKLDGSPSIVFGINPENKKFFVATKSVFNIEPKLYYKIDQIDCDVIDKGLKEKLTHSFLNLKKIVKFGIYQADLMYYGNDCDHSSLKDEMDFYTFTPNVIKYSIAKLAHGSESLEASKIRKSHIGIALHTFYVGKTLATLEAKFDLDFPGLVNHDHVYLVPIEHHVYQKANDYVVNTFLNSVSNIAKILVEVQEHHMCLGDPIMQDIKMMRMYVNHSFRYGTLLSLAQYKIFILKKFNEKKAKVKTNDAKKRWEDESRWFITEFDTHKEECGYLFNIINELHQMKNVLYNPISNQKDVFYSKRIKDAECKGEGFVIATPKHVAKIVDREEFSHLNKLAYGG